MAGGGETFATCDERAAAVVSLANRLAEVSGWRNLVWVCVYVQVSFIYAQCSTQNRRVCVIFVANPSLNEQYTKIWWVCSGMCAFDSPRSNSGGDRLHLEYD